MIGEGAVLQITNATSATGTSCSDRSSWTAGFATSLCAPCWGPESPLMKGLVVGLVSISCWKRVGAPGCWRPERTLDQPVGDAPTTNPDRGAKTPTMDRTLRPLSPSLSVAFTETVRGQQGDYPAAALVGRSDIAFARACSRRRNAIWATC